MNEKAKAQVDTSPTPPKIESLRGGDQEIEVGNAYQMDVPAADGSRVEREVTITDLRENATDDGTPSAEVVAFQYDGGGA